MAGKFPGGHALVVGVDIYPHSEKHNVPNTAQDAIQLSRVLFDPALCGYDPANVATFFGSSATRQNILAALKTFASTLKSGDTLFVYFAGHGMFDPEGRYYLTTHETQFQKIDQHTFVAPETAISESQLLELLKNIPVQRLLTIFNACHAGTISPGALGEPAAEAAADSFSLPEAAQHEILATGEGRIVITACRSGQKAYFVKEPGRMTVFGQALVEGLSGQGSVYNHKGYISLFDLYEYLYDSVQARVHKWWNLPQEPVLTVREMAGSFPISLYRGSLPASPEKFEPAVPIPAGAVQQVSEIRLTLALAELPEALLKLQDPQVLAKLLSPKNPATQAISPADENLVNFYRICFKRSAFQRYIPNEQILQDYEDAVTDTITAINTGCLLNRIDRTIIKQYEGKLYFDNQRWNDQFDLIGGLLQKIRTATTGFKQSKPGYSEPAQVFAAINAARVEVMSRFNQVSVEAGVPAIAFSSHPG